MSALPPVKRGRGRPCKNPPLPVKRVRSESPEESDDKSLSSTDSESTDAKLPPSKKSAARKSLKVQPPQTCVCNWGEECARFRRYFDRVKEKDGTCVFAGVTRTNIGGGERQANFLDAVDRHLKTSAAVRKKRQGRYVIANHHWTKDCLVYASKLPTRSMLLPVPNDKAVQLGIAGDPLDVYTTHTDPDEYGRMRPVRDASSDTTEPVEKQWVLAPCNDYNEVKRVVDDSVAEEIRKRLEEKKAEKREKRQQLDESVLLEKLVSDSVEEAETASQPHRIGKGGTAMAIILNGGKKQVRPRGRPKKAESPENGNVGGTDLAEQLSERDTHIIRLENRLKEKDKVLKEKDAEIAALVEELQVFRDGHELMQQQMTCMMELCQRENNN